MSGAHIYIAESEAALAAAAETARAGHAAEGNICISRTALEPRELFDVAHLQTVELLLHVRDVVTYLLRNSDQGSLVLAVPRLQLFRVLLLRHRHPPHRGDAEVVALDAVVVELVESFEPLGDKVF